VKLAADFKPKEEVRMKTIRISQRAMMKQPTKDVNDAHCLAQWNNLYERVFAVGVPAMPYGINHEIRNLLRAVQLMYDFFSSE
jgi:hypothetical protein